MTISHAGEETAAGAVPGPGALPDPGVPPGLVVGASAEPHSGPRLTPVAGLESWQAEFRDGLTGESESGAGDEELVLSCTGAGDLVVTASESLVVPDGTVAVQLCVRSPGIDEPEHVGELFLQLAGGHEVRLGQLDFAGEHLLRHTLPTGARITGLVAHGLFFRTTAQLAFSRLAFESAPTSPVPPAPMPPSPYGDSPSMLPSTGEEVTNTIHKDGISYVFEARSLSAVVRYVYTPIEGNLSDFEIEINNGDPIKLSEDGGVSVTMAGQDWDPADEGIERHFVSCELVGDCIEARWQFRRGSELADFLYRVRIEGKSLLVELEGGGGKATGVQLGYVVGAIHPRLIQVPYFNLGDQQPTLLCTSGVFISSFLDWYESRASSLHAAPRPEDQLMHLNGGCHYRVAADGVRVPLRERWVLTVSRRFDEVLPANPELHDAGVRVPVPPQAVWCVLPDMESGEEAYIDAYERLRMFRQVGMTDLLVLHPDTTWHDGAGGVPAIDSVGAEAKGGDDALLEYLEAVRDLGYAYGLSASFRHISPHDQAWSVAAVALDNDGELARTGPGRYQLKVARAAALAGGCVGRLRERYGAAAVFLADHAAAPPWDRVDCDPRLPKPASFGYTLRHEQALLADVGRGTVPVVGDGGNHWLYAGLLSGYVGRLCGHVPAEQPLLVDFALRYLHGRHIDAGVGTPEEYFGGQVPEEERDARSAWLDRYLAATVAFGHAGLLPDLAQWGLPAVAKIYYMLRKLQSCYLGADLESIHYQRGGNLLETTEALVAGAHDLSQVRVIYANGLHVYVNGARDEEWTVEFDEDTVYRLPPASFLARGPGDLLVYSADAGRIDYAACPEYLYCDTRGERLTMAALTLTGAAVLTHQDWVIDVYPLDCTDTLEVDPARIWRDRRMPPLRVLAYRDDEDEPEVLSASVAEGSVTITPQDEVYRYRITLPEWMVEPGK